MPADKILLGHILAFLTIVFWGTTFVSTKVLLQDFSPVEVLFFRFVIGYVSLLAVCPRLLKTTGWKQERIFMGAGLSGIALYFLLENIALKYTFASNVGVIVAIAPFCTAILAQFLLRGERLTVYFFVGFAAAMAGICCIAFNGSQVLQLNPLGDALAAAAAVAWAFYSICMRKIGEFRYNTVLCTRRVFFYGLVIMLPLLPLWDFHWGFERFSKPVNLGNILFLGFGASALCFVTWNWAVKVLGAIKASVYIYLVPVCTVLAAAIILDERITGLAMLGTALTLLGLVISEFSPKDKRQGATTGGKNIVADDIDQQS